MLNAFIRRKFIQVYVYYEKIRDCTCSGALCLELITRELGWQFTACLLNFRLGGRDWIDNFCFRKVTVELSSRSSKGAPEVILLQLRASLVLGRSTKKYDFNYFFIKSEKIENFEKSRFWVLNAFIRRKFIRVYIFNKKIGDYVWLGALCLELITREPGWQFAACLQFSARGARLNR